MAEIDEARLSKMIAKRLHTIVDTRLNRRILKNKIKSKLKSNNLL